MSLTRRSFFKGLTAIAISLKLPQVVIEYVDPGPLYLLRGELWSKEIKELLLDELVTMKFTKVFDDDEIQS